MLLLCQCAGAEVGSAAGDVDAARIPGAGKEPDAASPSDARLLDVPRAVADAAAKDRSPSDPRATPDFPPVKCSDNLLFCEDFEAGGLDPARWSQELTAATIQLDTTRFFSGKSSLHIKLKGTAAGTHATVQTLKRFPVKGSNLNVRMRIYMDKLTPSRFTPIVAMADRQSGGPYIQMLQMDVIPASETNPNAGPVQFFYEFAPNGNPPAGGRVPADQWACWELEFVNGKGATFYLEDLPVQGLTQRAPANFPTFDDVPIWVGAYLTHDDVFKHTDGFNIWVDDIAVSDKRIGCAP